MHLSKGMDNPASQAEHIAQVGTDDYTIYKGVLMESLWSRKVMTIPN